MHYFNLQHIVGMLLVVYGARMISPLPPRGPTACAELGFRFVVGPSRYSEFLVMLRPYEYLSSINDEGI